MRWFAIVLAGLAVQGCTLPLACTLEFRYGLKITAWDVSTHELVDSTPTGTLTAGTYREMMEAGWNDAVLLGAGERPGSYDVEVTAPGYRPWRRTDVEVRMGRNECHVELTALDAFMRRSDDT